MDIEVLMKKGYTATAAYVQSECLHQTTPETLLKILKHLLDPLKKIDDWSTIEWLKKIMAGGMTVEEFGETVQKYDTATTCGLVWTANFVAYRCRTCGISPCMSLCAECFKRGDHSDHDFNMFRSQAGGACDCGDTNVMKESGFCPLHGSGTEQRISMEEPEDLLAVARVMVPRLIYRLVIYMRENSNSLSGFIGAIESADSFIQMLHDMSGMGAAMRAVMSSSFSNPVVYKNLLTEEDSEFLTKCRTNYEEALGSLVNPEPPDEYKDIPSLQPNLTHTTFLEEFVFWTAKFEFPQKIVCLLLNLLPDGDYKESFTRAFVLHYSRISQLLVTCQNPDMLSNRVVHVSVQLFSNEKLAVKMTEEMKLLHVMVISLKYMMGKIINATGVVDCGHLVMKDHCYWPLVSDLNNILSHRPVAMKFLEDDGLIRMWFSFLSMFQGMNINIRELNQHIEFEPSTYYAAFSAELEASASPMWALVSHLKDSTTAHLTRNLLSHCRSQLRSWLQTVDFDEPPASTVSFHLPLHRYYSVFLHQAVKYQGVALADLLPGTEELLQIIQHPLRVQTAFYEIISGLWVRNGLQIKGQAMTYVQCHFCNSMVDADLYLLQVASGNLDGGRFLQTVVEKFHCTSTLSLSNPPPPTPNYLEPEQTNLMLENCAIFLTTLASIRTSIGITDTDLVTLEMITLLCMGDRTHSQLMELIPERCGNQQSRDFEQVLSEVADYHAPNFESSGNMLQGMYSPKAHVWEQIYDPIYILLRAVHRMDFQTSLDRFADHTKTTHPTKTQAWPPFRLPILSPPPYTDPRKILSSKVLHGICFTIFYKSVHGGTVSDRLVALAVFLLEMALSVETVDDMRLIAPVELNNYGKYDMNFSTWYGTDNLFANLKEEIDELVVGGCEDEMEMETLEESTSALATIATPRPRHLSIMPSGTNLQIVLAETGRLERAEMHHSPIQPIHESLISLLLKLHSKLTSTPNSYLPGPSSSTRLGDGPFFISNLLNKIAELDEPCKTYINATRSRLWPTHKMAPQKSAKSKAEERQAKMLADMASKQKQWMEKFGNEMEMNAEDTDTDGAYECVICSQGKDEIVGCVVLVQMTSAMEWRGRVALPVCGGDPIPQCKKENWTRGLLITTCGHHIHSDCLKGYLNALKSQQRQHNISIERGEYACPVCRQLANSFLPINDVVPEVIDGTCTVDLFKPRPPPDPNPLTISSRKALDDLINLAGGSSGMCQTVFTTNTLRLNLEIELLLGEKSKTCIVPLINALQSGHGDRSGMYADMLAGRVEGDPCDTLLELALALPLRSGVAYFQDLTEKLMRVRPSEHLADLANLLKRLIYGGEVTPLTSSPLFPSLLLLPPLYDTIFQHYQCAQCSTCHLTPKDPLVCLICSKLVCMREPCCKSGNLFEATKHSLECGAGTCVFLSVNKSTIVVFRGKRACLWGSVYLDSFGEEDRELKRGKPLYLCKERYELLEQQWVQHRFDHTARKWFFHRDTL